MNISSEHIKNLLLALPEKPGIYQHFNREKEIIYIGKAKNLKKRVSSYFNKTLTHSRTISLVKNIADIKYIVVDSEEEALLLENNLIKKHQPRYNVLLKDGKTYPSICIKKENFPRIFITRNIIKDGSEYYGPFISAGMIKNLLEYFRETFQIRTCNYDLSDEKIKNGQYKACLEYHIKNCKGACQGFQSKEEYNRNINQIREILKGNSKQVSEYLLQEMRALADNYQFEEAQVIKKKYEQLEHVRSKWTVVNPQINNVDVFSISENENEAYINFLKIVNGSVIQAYTIEYKKKIDEMPADLLAMAIVELRQRFNSTSPEILVPFPIDFEINNAEFTIPLRGDKKKLLDLSEQNVKQYKADKLKQQEKLNPEQRFFRIMNNIQKELNLTELPTYIECFDNSNIQGAHPVAACVVFRKGRPAKKEYRIFNIKTVEGPDDYASMKEVVFRRYSRLINEKEQLPNLIITDGGKGQMEVVRQVIQEELNLDIPIAGLAKDNRHHTKELLFGFPPKVISLKSNDELFKTLAFIQEEAHRFAIRFHRKKRSKHQIQSELDNIKGIGVATKSLLLKKYKSLKRIIDADIEDIANIVGKAKAAIIKNHFNENSHSTGK